MLYSSRFWPNIYVSKSPFKILEYHSMLSRVSFSGEELVLDLGCGGGLQTCCLAKKAKKVIGVDVCDLTKADKKRERVSGRLDVEFINSRLQDAHFNNETFDKIFSFCVVEHIPEYEEILRKCLDLLKPGGELIISVDSLCNVPTELKNIHKEEHSVVHYFSKEELHRLLEKVGYKEVETKPLFRGRFATWLFSNGIKNGFEYSVYGAIFQWMLLSVSERFASKCTEGMFLEARGRKR